MSEKTVHYPLNKEELKGSTQPVQKFSTEELDSIKEIRKSIEQKLIQFGDLKVSRINIQQQWDQLDEYEKKLTDEFLEIKKSEIKLTEVLNEKYGTGTLNIDTGEFSGNK